MIPDFQTIAAWIIVALTVALFFLKRFKKRKKGCGGECDCPSTPSIPFRSSRRSK